MDRTSLNEHDANQGAQSNGEFLGMTGNSGWYLLGSAGASILIVILFWGILGVSLLLCLLVGVVLCALSVAYVFALKNNRPEHYDTDFFEAALIEAGVMALTFGPRERRPKNPFLPGAGHDAEALQVPSRPATTRSARVAPTGSIGPTKAERPSASVRATEPPRRERPSVEEPVVPMSAYENLREELDTTSEMLEDALVERGEI